MSIETDLIAILLAQCPRVAESVAAIGTPVPRIVFQHIGGKTVRFTEGTPASKRNIHFQVSSWAASGKLAFDLARQIEDALCSSLTLQVDPQGEPLAAIADGGEDIHGAVQTFSVWGAR